MPIPRRPVLAPAAKAGQGGVPPLPPEIGEGAEQQQKEQGQHGPGLPLPTPRPKAPSASAARSPTSYRPRPHWQRPSLSLCRSKAPPGRASSPDMAWRKTVKKQASCGSPAPFRLPASPAIRRLPDRRRRIRRKASDMPSPFNGMVQIIFGSRGCTRIGKPKGRRQALGDVVPRPTAIRRTPYPVGGSADTTNPPRPVRASCCARNARSARRAEPPDDGDARSPRHSTTGCAVPRSRHRPRWQKHLLPISPPRAFAEPPDQAPSVCSTRPAAPPCHSSRDGMVRKALDLFPGLALVSTLEQHPRHPTGPKRVMGIKKRPNRADLSLKWRGRRRFPAEHLGHLGLGGHEFFRFGRATGAVSPNSPRHRPTGTRPPRANRFRLRPRSYHHPRPHG